MKRLFLFLSFLLIATATPAAYIYSSAGLNDGSSCANARALSTHAIGDDVAGNTLHLSNFSETLTTTCQAKCINRTNVI